MYIWLTLAGQTSYNNTFNIALQWNLTEYISDQVCEYSRDRKRKMERIRYHHHLEHDGGDWFGSTNRIIFEYTSNMCIAVHDDDDEHMCACFSLVRCSIAIACILLLFGIVFQWEDERRRNVFT